MHILSQDDYLSGRRGQYAERYGALSPWRGRRDVKFLQDYKIKVSENKTNTIQFSIDVLKRRQYGISSELGTCTATKQLFSQSELV